jgi:hypothetical protein
LLAPARASKAPQLTTDPDSRSNALGFICTR